MVLDSLIVIGASVLSLGTIQEADGMVERTFLLRNAGKDTLLVHQAYTSCGCTSVTFEQGRYVSPGDTTAVGLHFDPRGKGGDFYEQATLVYGKQRKRVNMALEGRCNPSEATLLRRFPIRVNDHLRISTDHFDLGVMHIGEQRERGVVVLHCDEDNRQERLTITFKADETMHKGLQRTTYPLRIMTKAGELTADIAFDVIIK